jgi:tetratricopeptide (TPR) repeat protein
MKRLILLLCLVAVRCALCAGSSADDLLRQGQAAFNGGKFDDALNLYERVFTGHPEAVDRWYGAQRGIAVTLARKGDLAGAAKAAHICLDGAPNFQSFDDAVGLAANILSAIDGKVDRANQFIGFQQTGPVGGATDPMEAIGYPALPEREQAFATPRQKAGDNAAASRLRAFTYLFTGKPREALAQFADAFRRSSTNMDLERSGPDLVLIGLRAARGYRTGLERGLQFLSFGPDGPDGKPKTADDIPDPFAPLLSAPPAPDEGGLAGIDAGDLDALRKLRDAAALYVADPFLRIELRRTALPAMERANDTLDAWTANREEWFLDIARRAGGPYLDMFLYQGAQMAARDRALDFGGARAFWARIDADCAARGVKPPQGMIAARSQLQGVWAALDKIKIQQPAFKMLQKPAAF